MKKINIIKKNIEFEKMLKLKPYKSDIIYIYFNINKLNINRFGIAVPKKLGKAVIRNKFKRRIKDIVDDHIFNNQNGEYLLVAKQKILEKKYSEIKIQLDQLFDLIEKEKNHE